MRYVTGRSDIDWPDIDLSQGFWITSEEEREAPTFAFQDVQETTTFTTIIAAEASSEHIGPFNSFQRSLFAHLADNDFFGGVHHVHGFSAERSYAKATAPIGLTIPWVNTRELPSQQVMVNRYYPIGYFALANVDRLIQTDPEFWASEEKLPPETDYLIFDFGTERPVNFLDLEICAKPIDMLIEYDDGGNWVPVDKADWFDGGLQVNYLPSMDSSWNYFEYHFELVQTQKLRITFTRRDESFPLDSSASLPNFMWSIEVRNARPMHMVNTVSDFVVDTGTDILGNSYRTDIVESEAGFVIDSDVPGEFGRIWQSQPNPSPNAIEALYFDLRTGRQS